MKKLLIVLFALMGFATMSNASVFVSVSETEFDDLVHESLSTDPYIVIVEAGNIREDFRYVFYKDGFHFETSLRGQKTFSNPKIYVVPAQSLTSHKKAAY